MIASANQILSIVSGGNESFSGLSACLLEHGGPCAAFGLPGAHRAFTAAALAQQQRLLVITHSESAAMQLHGELAPLCESAVLFPAREIQLYGALAQSIQLREKRVAALCAINNARVVVLCAQAAMQLLPPPEAFNAAILALEAGHEYPQKELIGALLSSGYIRADMAEGKGHFSVRGGILDVYPITEPYPLRFEFFGDTLETIRSFDPVTQRSMEKLTHAQLPPAVEAVLTRDAAARGIDFFKANAPQSDWLSHLERGTLPLEGAENYLPAFYDGCTIFDYARGFAFILDDPARLEEAAQAEYARFTLDTTAMLERGEGFAQQQKLMISPQELLCALNTNSTAMLFALPRDYKTIRPKRIFEFGARPAPQYYKAQKLAQEISLLRAKNAVLMFAGERHERLREELLAHNIACGVADALERAPVAGETLIIGESLPMGGMFEQQNVVILSEAELFGAVKKPQRPKKRSSKLAFTELSVGDVIVHEAHGIGRFIGVETLNVDSRPRDYLVIQYAGADKLYLPTDQLDRIQKYIGAGESAAPKLSKLGGAEWGRSLDRAREGVRKLTFDLVSLYSARYKQTGHAFAKDTEYQRMLEDRFPYEETADQIQSIEEIKRDMESERIMDRLLCGDVGYGKTEVALRAAFKAVMDSKQVALLAPTTILAQQHYNTFISRFEGFPVSVDMLSRFSSAAKQRATLKKLARGEIDLLVGTHRMLGDDVKFNNLGLLIIDEEQRFGVGHKEKIKNIKHNVDVLSLTATPIPRTLHMSMVGIRDMSVIETPPENRYPVQTYVLEYSDSLVRDAILSEINHGGQVYFVYNRVQSIESFALRLRALLPKARIAIAHGQMGERMLETVMLKFMAGEYDVLLCSTIIESGLDIANVNTIIIYDADKMGLSQLYQLRGRVGRSDRLGHAYLTFQRDKVLSEVAQKRLLTISEFTEFGSGFKIAMRDLEIRGAGNILGAEQHGHMAEIGYDLYCKLVESAIHEAKGEPLPIKMDTIVDIPLGAHIPKHYIPTERIRLEIYKRIASITSTEDMYDVQEELEDRFGKIPMSVQSLLDIALLKAQCALAQVAALSITKSEARLTLHENSNFDAPALFELLRVTPLAQLLPDGMVIQLRRKSGDIKATMQFVAGFVHNLSDCINTPS